MELPASVERSLEMLRRELLPTQHTLQEQRFVDSAKSPKPPGPKRWESPEARQKRLRKATVRRLNYSIRYQMRKPVYAF